MPVERFELRPGYSISRVIKGGWHLAGGHGSIDATQAIDDMLEFVKAGITTFDCADIYTGVEELIGRFLRVNRDAFASGALPHVQVHTKYVPDYDALSTLKPNDINRIIDRSLQRLGVERLDLVQFAWWDYSVPGYVEAAMHLAALREEGKIRHIGITNFDAQHMQEILDAGVPIVANQVQYSILDHRAEHDLDHIAREYGIPYLCYGVIAGGFLSDPYLNAPDPPAPLENRSLVKYRLIIDEFGGYELFQEALRTLRTIADKHGVGIAEVAARYILQKDLVAGIIVGARHARHLGKLQQLDTFRLDAVDIDAIAKITARSKGPSGSFYALERDKEGKHGRIMKYNLNRE